MDDTGEPVGRGQLDRRAAEAHAVRDAAFAIAIFSGIVAVNGILAILLIELLQLAGWWEAAPTESLSDTATRLSSRIRPTVAFGS